MTLISPTPITPLVARPISQPLISHRSSYYPSSHQHSPHTTHLTHLSPPLISHHSSRTNCHTTTHPTTTHLAPIISQHTLHNHSSHLHSSHTTRLTPPVTQHTSHTTHLTPFISYRSSHARHLTPPASNLSSNHHLSHTKLASSRKTQNVTCGHRVLLVAFQTHIVSDKCLRLSWTVFER